MANPGDIKRRNNQFQKNSIKRLAKKEKVETKPLNQNFNPILVGFFVFVVVGSTIVMIFEKGILS